MWEAMCNIPSIQYWTKIKDHLRPLRHAFESRSRPLVPNLHELARIEFSALDRLVEHPESLNFASPFNGRSSQLKKKLT